MFSKKYVNTKQIHWVLFYSQVAQKKIIRKILVMCRLRIFIVTGLCFEANCNSHLSKPWCWSEWFWVPDHRSWLIIPMKMLFPSFTSVSAVIQRMNAKSRKFNYQLCLGICTFMASFPINWLVIQGSNQGMGQIGFSCVAKDSLV